MTKGSPPELFYNPHSWSTVANVLYLEQPKGVGFSYCDAATDGDGVAAKCVNTDESTAIDGHEFLVNWFKAFPEYASNDFFITGESYAGLYIPMLMDQIDIHGDIPNFKGAMIGNGCWGSDCFYGMSEPEIDYHIFQGHAMIPYPLKLHDVHEFRVAVRGVREASRGGREPSRRVQRVQHLRRVQRRLACR